MRNVVSAAIATMLMGLATMAGAQTVTPQARLPLQDGFDLPGGDLGPIFNINQSACVQACLTNESCTALTYNAASRACFPKANPGDPIPFGGALSGEVIRTDPITAARARDRAEAAKDWLYEGDRNRALSQATELGQTYPGYGMPVEDLRSSVDAWRGADPQGALRAQGAVTALTDLAADWATLSALMTAAAKDANNSSALRQAALDAATNAWLRDPGNGAGNLALWAQAAEELGRGRNGLQALRAGPEDAPAIAAIIDEFEGRYGFRVSDHMVASDGPEPRLCIFFSENVARNVDLRPFVGLPDPALGIETQGSDLCITGMARGQDITVTMRAGLPSATGEKLRRDVATTAYIPDRSPLVRFPGRAYVLPASGDLGLTMSTVNTAEVALTLYRMSDRNLVGALRDDMFGMPLDGWRQSSFTGQLGEAVWTGFATIAPPAGGGDHPVNAEVATRLDLRDQAGPLLPGIYALSAAVPNADPDVSPAATQWFMVSDLGLSSFSGTDGLTVAVRGLSDAGARPGIEVALISRGNAVLGTALTDDQGIARFDAGLTRGRDAAAPALVTATRMEGEDVADLSFLSLTDPEFDLSDRGVEGNPPAPPVDVFMALDRGAYRAGETAHATILARDGLAGAIDGLPMQARIIRPDGAEFSRVMPAPAGDGGYVLDFAIPATATRGAWRIDLRVEEDGPALASARMLVEDFLPERIDFALELGDAPLPPSGRVTTEIAARWLFGAPAADLPVEGQMILSPARSLPGWDGYQFGRHDDTQSQSAEMLAGRTDADGNFTANVDLPATMATATRPWTAELRLNVLEGAGRPVERRDDALVLPAKLALGIRPGFDGGTVPEGSDAPFQIVALGPDLTPQAGSFTWELNKIDTDYQWYAIDGDWQWEPVTNRSSAGSGSIELAAGQPTTLSVPVTWGEFELVLRGADGSESSVLFDAGWGAVSASQDTPDRLRVTLDKPAYRPGETATVTFEAPADGAALISVISNRLIALETVATSAGTNSVELPVTDDWGAGVYVAVSAIRPVGTDAGHAPVRGLGLVPAAVDPGAKLLQASLEAPAETDPRQDAQVTLRVAGAEPGETVHATIWAVDQGILNLTGYEPPSASDHYFGQRRLGVGLRDLYGRLILASGAADGAIRSGGDASGPGTTAPPPTEKLMAWFSGPVTLGADGTATVAVPLPDFNGEVRLIALAWSKTGVGQADMTMLVRDPVVMTVTAPPFLAPGDQARAEIALTHVSGPAGDVGLSVAPEGGTVTLATADLPASVPLAEGERKPLTLLVTAPQTEGAAGLRVAATLPDGRTVTKDLQIPVLRLDQPVTRALRMTLEPGASVTPDLAALGAFAPGSGRLTMSVGAYALLDIPAALTLLRDFDYGCTEQITSAAMPQLYAAGLMPEDAPTLPGDPPRTIESAITQILTRQTPEGGFGLWSAQGAEPWLNAYVTDFLSRARQSGHAVPETNFRRALTSLQNYLNASSDPQYASADEAAAMAYSAYVLARERSAVVSDLRYYADMGSESFATPMAAAQLGAALAFLGDQPRADRMFGRAVTLIVAQADPQGLRRDFGTSLRDRAAVLALAAEAGSQRVDRDTLAAAIARDIASRSYGLSTQEALWTVMAGQALVSGSDPAQGVTLGGAPLPGPVADLGDAATPIAQPLGNSSGSPVDVTLSVTAIPTDPVAAGGTAYQITRRYFTPEGQPVDPSLVAQGQRMVAVLEVTAFNEGQDGRLIITDPLPAGFEIDNPNLIAAGELSGLDWLQGDTQTEMTEFRSDRFAASVEFGGEGTLQLAYRLRAVTPGSFHHPAASVADFYRAERRGWTESGVVIVAP
ncbi:alpha-2-macroglobulin family protein [Paracoccus xiamenensis]|uniref:alpha-2-macroglobulin family protein n=1 Tax=Paracoccus xiamenensis TaxID=2714901 RepID=UPI00140D937B|nr:alpha-2-macroglobulin family protein [Paracoccus xiamenensis]NHF72789.1 alpha-2-macroglobulin [Paracoccus xiamenensis]